MINPLFTAPASNVPTSVSPKQRSGLLFEMVAPKLNPNEGLRISLTDNHCTSKPMNNDGFFDAWQVTSAEDIQRLAEEFAEVGSDLFNQIVPWLTREAADERHDAFVITKAVAAISRLKAGVVRPRYRPSYQLSSGSNTSSYWQIIEPNPDTGGFRWSDTSAQDHGCHKGY